MPLTTSRLKQIIREAAADVYEEESREHEISEAADAIANQLRMQYGDDGAIKLLTYALDIAYSKVHGEGVYEPSELEREEFMQEPYPGSRRKVSGKIDLDAPGRSEDTQFSPVPFAPAPSRWKG